MAERGKVRADGKLDPSPLSVTSRTNSSLQAKLLRLRLQTKKYALKAAELKLEAAELKLEVLKFGQRSLARQAMLSGRCLMIQTDQADKQAVIESARETQAAAGTKP